ncbi:MULTISPECIES: hypothetical protein [unclassified Pseudomonas]|uniref:hypothetical protein n=1 Tax=unclassified Pseudomonas TaxID=196821 RepID=UPI00387A8819
MAAIYIGISGWRGACYPVGLSQKRELQCALRAATLDKHLLTEPGKLPTSGVLP